MNEKKNRSLGGVLMFLLKLPFRMAALPLLIALLAVRFLSALITGLSSIVTNAICTLSFAVAAGIWMFGVGTSQDALHILSIGLTFLLLPRIADWVVEKATDLGTTLVAFLLGWEYDHIVEPKELAELGYRERVTAYLKEYGCGEDVKNITQ